MAKDGQSAINLTKAGKVDLSELRQTFAATAASNVSVTDWGVCYNSGTGQLSEYCTVTASNPNDPITGIGMLAYSSNGSSLYCLQYTNDISSTSVATSVGTTLYNPQDGNEVLCVVYGWTQSAPFHFTDTITIVPCQ